MVSYDERKPLLIAEHGLRLLVIEKSAFAVRSKRIVRDRARDTTVVRDCLGECGRAGPTQASS